MIKLLADPNMVGDRVGEHTGSGFVALFVIALFFYVLLDGPLRRKK